MIERAHLLCAAGAFSCFLAIHLLTNAARIDIIDGQVRYDVAASWLDTRAPTIRDRALMGQRVAIRGQDATYAAYNAGASLSPMPFMLLSRLVPGHTVERDRVAFSMAGPVFGAAVGALLVLAYGMLDRGPAASLAWATVISLATLWWPGSVTVFDQNQHAFFLLAGSLLAWRSGRRKSRRLAALAGVASGFLITYQESYALLLPFVGLAVFAASPEDSPAGGSVLRRPIDQAGWLRYVAFAAGGGVGLLLFVAFNVWRYSAFLQPGRYDVQQMFSGNPIAGLLSLTLSPGKSMFLFSPPLVLAFFGARGLFRRVPTLAAVVGLISVAHVLLVIQLAFFGGDWCWGPRYLLVLLPLWALSFPFALERVPRWIVGALVTLGFGVQLMAISVDHQRFFLEHNLPPYFWLDQWAYFKRSQLFSRPFELLSLARGGVPPEAKLFSPTPGAQITYAPFGPLDHRDGARWARHFAVFHTLRPWPFWIRFVDPAQRPMRPWPAVLVCGGLFIGGGALLLLGLRRSSPQAALAEAGALATPSPFRTPDR